MFIAKLLQIQYKILYTKVKIIPLGSSLLLIQMSDFENRLMSTTSVKGKLKL